MKSKSALDRLHIGQRLRKLRKAQGLTLETLAERTGLSAAFISMAERDKSMPSIVSLLRLSRALGVEITELMEMPDNVSVVHRAAAPQVVKLDSPLMYYDLASRLDDQRLDIFMITVPPGFAYPIETRPGEHFRYVIKGELWSKVGDLETVLGPGDSMHFDARLPHGAENRTEEEVVFLYVGTPSFL
jgi:transcriptional regulator with XRE-family HTH domain